MWRNHPPSLFSKRMNTDRRAVSPVIATTIILAITVALGLGLWGFANSGVGTATAQYSQTVDKYGEFVGDRFIIANIDFDNPSPGSISVWVFNSGKLSTTVSNLVLTCRDCGAEVPSVELVDPITIPSKQLVKITFDLTDPVAIAADDDFGGKTYDLTLISDTGAIQAITVKSD
jgi:flagellin-like protein